MVGVFGVGMAIHFSPKDLGLSAEIYGTVFGQSGLDLWTVFKRSGAELCFYFGQFRDEFPDCSLAHVCCFCVITRDE